MATLPIIGTYGLLLQLRDILASSLEDVKVADTPATAADKPAVTRVKVHIGALPVRSGAADGPRPPFVLLQAMNGRDTDQLHEVTVLLRLALYGGTDPEESEAELHAVLSAMRLALLQLPGNATPDGAFRMDTTNGLPWERPDAQGSPFVEAYITTIWQTRAARETTAL